MIKNTCVPDCLSVLRFAPAIKIIGRTSGKIFNGRYTVFAKGDEHLVRHTWNVLETIFDARVLSFHLQFRLRTVC